MVIKVYVSGISGNVLMKLQQEHISRILECKKIDHTTIDIADPKYTDEKSFMQTVVEVPDENVPLPPQIFNGKNYCGDYEAFHRALECEYLFEYLSLTAPQHEVEFMRKNAPRMETEL